MDSDLLRIFIFTINEYLYSVGVALFMVKTSTYKSFAKRFYLSRQVY